MPRYDCKPLPTLSEKDITKLWLMINKRGPDDCWIYRGWCNDQGYGMFRAANRNLRVHRLAYFLSTGKDPYPLLVCHKCDVGYKLGDLTYRRCCNPAHVFIGTHADNSSDMAAKGRSTIGDRNPSRLYPERVPRGERHASRTHPECVPKGSKHWNWNPKLHTCP